MLENPCTNPMRTSSKKQKYKPPYEGLIFLNRDAKGTASPLIYA
jgi:hypothetical protein